MFRKDDLRLSGPPSDQGARSGEHCRVDKTKSARLWKSKYFKAKRKWQTKEVCNEIKNNNQYSRKTSRSSPQISKAASEIDLSRAERAQGETSRELF
ncbi:hypothetical protein PoB_005741500 [Plakobranchus ocellatus]|uniref:Uncharacterized protein n=1 Tax=Plakobranchus ocellatus TaxID=259542 RepID=A0AAV4CDR9_9GAST|nr:hypothetical protein PoB_005741500 [Plakobranchus ocellatus]